MLHNTVHRLVEHFAQAAPDAPAVATEQMSFSYSDLNARANRLAHRLREHGVGVESRVGVALPRSPEAIVAFLAVLKAGGAYVPLDPDYPAQRLDFMLDDAQVMAVVASAETSKLLTRPGLALLDVDEGTNESNIDLLVPGNACAYVIYTSGSTGMPKGVAVSHDNILSLIGNDPRLAVKPGDTVAHFAPTAFDAATFEIWAALCRGARVAVLPAGQISLPDLSRLLRHWRPDWLFLTTGLFHLVADFDLGALGAVGRLLTGGDILAPQHIAAAAEVTSVFAAYGPTETTTFASLYDVAAWPAPTGRVPIGVPLDNVEFRVLDDALHPVAEGEIGELYLCGGGVARGYHGRAALTAGRFVADPVATHPGTRMYRTGDRVRQLPNGQFDFHGRADRQVKVRGFRIELGEVESLLSGCPQVSSVAVVAVPGADGDKRLAAYAAVSPGAALAVSQLRGYAMRTLPAHAVPATFLLLDQLPLDANGKVDRRALPDPWASRDGLHGLPPYAPPRTELERVIAVAWAEALELDEAGINDDFFALGGDSLRSVSVLERLRAQGIRFSAGDFFGHPTVAELAALAEQASAQPPVPGLAALAEQASPQLPVAELAALAEQASAQVPAEPGGPAGQISVGNSVAGRAPAHKSLAG